MREDVDQEEKVPGDLGTPGYSTLLQHHASTGFTALVRPCQKLLHHTAQSSPSAWPNNIASLLLLGWCWGWKHWSPFSQSHHTDTQLRWVHNIYSQLLSFITFSSGRKVSKARGIKWYFLQKHSIIRVHHSIQPPPASCNSRACTCLNSNGKSNVVHCARRRRVGEKTPLYLI